MPTKSTVVNTRSINDQPCATVTINSGVAQFLGFLGSKADAQVVVAAKTCLGHLCSYATDELPDMLDSKMQAEFRSGGKTFADWAPAGMLGLILDRFSVIT
jgi:hypothetical protein